MQSYVEQLKYRENGEQVVGGGFPLFDYVKKGPLAGQHGGSVGFARFEHLVIPVSIDSHDSTYYEPMVTNKVVCRNVIEDDLFDKLFNKVGEIKQSKAKTTRKSAPGTIEKKTTRKKSKQ